MSSEDRRTQARHFSARFAAAFADMWYAQRRAYVLRTALDAHTPKSHRPPETYSEFLARTSGLLLHEPPARVRLEGRRRRVG